MKSNRSIEDGSIVFRLECGIKIESFLSIIEYFNKPNTCQVIVFEDDTENWYDNLLDEVYEKYYYSDCETMFYLGILESSTFNDVIEFRFIKNNEELLKEIYRDLKIENVLNEWVNNINT